MKGRWIVAALAALPAALAAQVPAWTAATSVMSVRTHTSQTGGTADGSGTAFGAAGTVRMWRVELDGRYAEGTLQGGGGRRELVEGALIVRFRPARWVTLFAGPHARTYIGSAETERWVTWRAGVGAATPIIGSAVRGHAVLWRAVTASANVAPGAVTAQGGEVGVTLELPAKPFWLGLSYGVEQAEAGAGGGARRETVEGLVLTAGLRRQ